MADQMEIHEERTETNGENGGRYYVVIDGQLSEMTWLSRPPFIIIDHTFVPNSLRGRGIAQQLAEHAVKMARQHGNKIIPQCSYMDALMRRRDDWQDVKA